MKKLFFFTFLSALTFNSAFAQDYLSCNLKISDNKIDCPFFGACPQKELKESKSQLIVEVHEGETKKGKVQLKKVLVKPGTEDENDNKIIVFKDDQRPEKIKVEKKAEMISYDIKSGINYSVTKFGDTLDILFKTSAYELTITLSGNGRYQDYVLTDDNAISVFCEKLNKDVYEDMIAKKEALEIYKQEKAKAKVKAE